MNAQIEDCRARNLQVIRAAQNRKNNELEVRRAAHEEYRQAKKLQEKIDNISEVQINVGMGAIVGPAMMAFSVFFGAEHVILDEIFLQGAFSIGAVIAAAVPIAEIALGIAKDKLKIQLYLRVRYNLMTQRWETSYGQHCKFIR